MRLASLASLSQPYRKVGLFFSSAGTPMGMHAFRRLREQEAATATATAIAETPADGLLEPGTFDQHPPKRRGRKPKATAEVEGN